MPPGRPRKNPDDALMKSAELIGWAIGGLEREITTTRERLASLTAQAAKLRVRAGLKGIRGGATAGTAAAGADTASGDTASADTAAPSRKRRRNRMSPEARKRISEMMKKRWAEKRKGK